MHRLRYEAELLLVVKHMTLQLDVSLNLGGWPMAWNSQLLRYSCPPFALVGWLLSWVCMISISHRIISHHITSCHISIHIITHHYTYLFNPFQGRIGLPCSLGLPAGRWHSSRRSCPRRRHPTCCTATSQSSHWPRGHSRWARGSCPAPARCPSRPPNRRAGRRSSPPHRSHRRNSRSRCRRTGLGKEIRP